MGRTSVWRLALTSLTAAALVSLAAPALAHHKPDHQGGPSNASQAGGTVVTEDNDIDGFPNTPDPAGDTDNQHPSGKDRSSESGGSGNQGKSGSDPDGNTNGGADKPGGTGGVDQLDQDGNNGCGNDDDFEDDNEGHCSGAPVPPTTDKPPTKPTPPGKVDDDDVTHPKPERTIPDEVLGLTPDGGLPEVAVAAPAADRPSTLPMTGSSVATVLLAGLGLIVLGSSMVMVRRKA